MKTKNLLYIIPMLLTMPGLSQNLTNGGFENFGEQSVKVYNRQGGSFNNVTCRTDGGSVTLSETITGTARPLGFRTTDDIFKDTNASLVMQTTVASEVHTGNSALKLTSQSFGFGVGVFGVAGIFEAENLFQEALPSPYPFSGLPSAIEGFYKHESGTPVTIFAGTCTSNGQLAENTDFAGGFRVYAAFTKYNTTTNQRDTIALANEVFADATTYTAFCVEVNVLQAVIPDSMVFVMSNSPYFESPNAITIGGSTSFVDDVDFVFCTSPDLTITTSGRTLMVAEGGAGSYQWVDCDNGNQPIPGATAQSYTATASGNYAVILTDGACSETSACQFIDITACNTTSNTVVEACNSYEWLGMTYTASGTYQETLTNSLGCDSLLTLDLTIKTVNTTVQKSDLTLTSAAADATYQWLDCDNGNMPISGATSQSYTVSATGNYAVMVTKDGCTATSDCSFVDIVACNTSSDTTVTSCGPFTWLDMTFDESGVYTNTIPNGAGCDSVIILNLDVVQIASAVNVVGRTLQATEGADAYQWINCDGDVTIAGATNSTYVPEVSGDFAVEITVGECHQVSDCVTLDRTACNTTSTIEVGTCGAFFWRGSEREETGIYQDTIPNSVGCDSVLVLDFTRLRVNTDVTIDGDELVSGATDATYQWLNCAAGDAPIPGATERELSLNASGVFAVEVTTSDGCVDTSACVTIDQILASEKAPVIPSIKIYPNPATDAIHLDLGATVPSAEVTIRDLAGRVHQRMNFGQLSSARLPLQLRSGIYVIAIQAEGQPLYVQRISILN
ncbi:MAG: T9SS type A sorting domain-containing protein [Bacteroidota bacterium]